MSKDAISITKRNALVKSYIAAWKAGMNEPKNNVYTLGQQFHTTGLKLVESVINNKKAVYVAVTTQEGIDIPIKSLMGNPFFKDYYVAGEFDSVSRKDGKKVVTKVKAEAVDDYDFGRVFQPSCYQPLDFIAEADEQHFFEGKIITYLGKAVRPYEAKKDSPASSFEIYKKGDKRAMAVHLWKLKLTAAEQKKKEEAERAARMMRAECERREREEALRREKANYNQRNQHLRDSALQFTSFSHSYSVNGIPLQSVTDFVEHCFPEFNANEMARRTAARTGQSVADVLAAWERKGEESRNAGTEMHWKIESFYQLNNVQDDETFRLFRMFTNQIALNPYRTEWPIYDTDTNLAGTVDFVDYSNGRYSIYDWKRSDKIIFNGMPVMTSKYEQKALPPIGHIEDCPYFHYALQLSLYKYILEKNYGIEIADLRLGIFHPAYHKPYVLRIPYMKDEVETLMSLRKSVIL